MTHQSDVAEGKTRPLTAQEESLWLRSLIDPINAVMAVQIAGAAAIETWRAALDAVQQRHPLLSASIEKPNTHPDDEGHPAFRGRAAGPIPLTVLAWDQVPRWEAELERALAHPFTWGERPLLRATLIHGAERSILILAATHAITDGISLFFIVRDLLTAMTGGTLAPQPFPRSSEDLLGFGVEARAPSSEKPDPETQVSAHAFSHVRCEPETTRRFLRTCRARDCTLNGAFVAATVMALRRRMPGYEAKPVQVYLPISTRSLVGVSDACGMYLALSRLAFAPDDDLSFWNLARRTRRDVLQAAESQAIVASAARARDLVAAIVTRDDIPAELDRMAARDIICTNLGPVPFPARVGQFELEAVFPAVANSCPPFLSIAAATLNDVLHLTLTSRDPVPGVLESVVAILSENCLDP